MQATFAFKFYIRESFAFTRLVYPILRWLQGGRVPSHSSLLFHRECRCHVRSGTRVIMSSLAHSFVVLIRDHKMLQWLEAVRAIEWCNPSICTARLWSWHGDLHCPPRTNFHFCRLSETNMKPLAFIQQIKAEESKEALAKARRMAIEETEQRAEAEAADAAAAQRHGSGQRPALQGNAVSNAPFHGSIHVPIDYSDWLR